MPEYLEKMVESGMQFESDLVCCGWIHVKDLTNEVLLKYEGPQNKELSVSETIVSMLDSKAGVATQSWDKMFKLEIIKKMNLRFNCEVKFAEDLLFNVEYLQECEKVSIVSMFLYKYRVNAHSVTSKEESFNLNKLSAQIAFEIIDEKLRGEEEICVIFRHFVFIHTLNDLRRYVSITPRKSRTREVLDILNDSLRRCKKDFLLKDRQSSFNKVRVIGLLYVFSYPIASFIEDMYLCIRIKRRKKYLD